ncbi:MAG TPA: sugar ABC transporter ATP-binding protein [Roseiarcus sp.]|nr:sugar ABC transporter ATP-binding protein [Roseiarcus sp.]
MAALSVNNVSKTYDGNPALRNVSFTVDSGRVLAVCGENGAGKSTLIKILSGAVQPEAGEIALAGKPVAIRDPRNAIELGIRTVYQELSLLPHISVAENILLGKMPHRRLNWWVDWPRAYVVAADELAGFGFDRIDVRALVSELSVSEQQVVEIAKALAGQPKILILDEPTSILSARETGILFGKVRKLTAAGIIVIYISHRLEEIFEISDEVIVLKDGVNVLAAKTENLTRDALIHAMVGRSLAAIYPTRIARPRATLLECRSLCRAGVFKDVNFSVRAGEIVGMFGLVGSGRTDVARALFGATPATSGQILVSGAPVAVTRPADAIANGIAFVTEDRKRDGLALDLSVLDNGGLASMDRVSRRGVLNRKLQHKIVEAKLDALAVRPRGVSRAVRQLSGGNQQKVVLAKWLLLDHTRIFIFDEPTRGVDIATKVEIYRMMADLVSAESAVLLISSEMPEAIGMSDRLLIMRSGRIVAALERSELSMERVFALAVGVEIDRMTA